MGDIWLPRKGREEVGKKRGKWERKGGSGETGGIKRAKHNKEKHLQKDIWIKNRRVIRRRKER